ncbi:MAG: hypothetical protein KC777_11220, partial [Cyanobacteria bacterium HKST-UBA02]|nr:hypothetical protein [Cyanobacteria bacterium HKST-UBA02]
QSLEVLRANALALLSKFPSRPDLITGRKPTQKIDGLLDATPTCRENKMKVAGLLWTALIHVEHGRVTTTSQSKLSFEVESLSRVSGLSQERAVAGDELLDELRVMFGSILAQVL